MKACDRLADTMIDNCSQVVSSVFTNKEYKYK